MDVQISHHLCSYVVTQMSVSPPSVESILSVDISVNSSTLSVNEQSTITDTHEGYPLLYPLPEASSGQHDTHATYTYVYPSVGSLPQSPQSSILTCTHESHPPLDPMPAAASSSHPSTACVSVLDASRPQLVQSSQSSEQSSLTSTHVPFYHPVSVTTSHQDTYVAYPDAVNCSNSVPNACSPQLSHSVAENHSKDDIDVKNELKNVVQNHHPEMIDLAQFITSENKESLLTMTSDDLVECLFQGLKSIYKDQLNVRNLSRYFHKNGYDRIFVELWSCSENLTD